MRSVLPSTGQASDTNFSNTCPVRRTQIDRRSRQRCIKRPVSGLRAGRQGSVRRGCSMPLQTLTTPSPRADNTLRVRTNIPPGPPKAALYSPQSSGPPRAPRTSLHWCGPTKLRSITARSWPLARSTINSSPWMIRRPPPMPNSCPATSPSRTEPNH